MRGEGRELAIIKDKELADRVERFLPGVVVISALTGFSVLAWYAYHTNVATTSDEDLVLVEADKTPMKEKPLDPGGMKFPNQDKTIFETFANSSQTAKVERVLPSPEEPLPRGADTSGTQTWVNERLHKNISELEAVDKAVAAEAGHREQVIGDDGKKAEDVQAVAANLKPDRLSSNYAEQGQAKASDIVSYNHATAEKAAEKVVEKASEPATKAQVDAPAEKPVEKPVEKKVSGSVIKAATWEDASKEIVDEDALSAPAAPVKLKEVVPAKKEKEAEKSVVTARGGSKVQLGAYQSEKEARTEFNRIQRKFPAATGHEVQVIKADVAGKGTFYRLRLAGFGSAAEAKAFCSKLLAGGQACILPKD